ncbi:MAG: insulinase family protein [Clostridia bacterium]|nr:insulinase family protein [Clostridia bacterium]
MVTTKLLKSGVRLIVKQMDGLFSVTMGILVGTGAAFERDDEDGISHFIEHMQFKGTDTRTAFEISDAFDALGAQVNAFTGKDLTCYYAKSTSDHVSDAFALLSDLFLNSTFPEEEMKREKGVVLEEINMDEDSPEDLCLDLLARATFGSVAYGRNILGPAKNVKRFTREDLFRYKAERYCPENIVLSFAGNISIAQAEDLAERYFGDLHGEKFTQREKKIEYVSQNLFRNKQIEQAHFAISFPSVEREHPSMNAVQLMNAVLGGGMSSRLFKKVREELGLAYSVYSYTSHYQETGLLSVYAGVNPQKAEEAAKAVVSVIQDYKKNGLTEEEFLRGREQLKSSAVFSQENTSSQMLLYGKHLLYTGKVYDLEGRMAELTALKRQDVLDAISAHFDFARVSVASVGNLKEGIRV